MFARMHTYYNCWCITLENVKSTYKHLSVNKNEKKRKKKDIERQTYAYRLLLCCHYRYMAIHSRI